MEVVCPRCGAKAIVTASSPPERWIERRRVSVQSDFREKCTALAAEPNLTEWDCPEFGTVVTAALDAQKWKGYPASVTEGRFQVHVFDIAFLKLERCGQKQLAHVRLYVRFGTRGVATGQARE
jgi:hypothetical protein